MRRVLVLFAHPVLERSRVNRRLLDAIRELAGVSVQDLYEEYPTLAIDVQRWAEHVRERLLAPGHDAQVRDRLPCRLDGSREALRDGLLGRLVDPGNRAELLAAVRHALASTERTVPEGLSHFSFAQFEARVHQLVSRIA